MKEKINILTQGKQVFEKKLKHMSPSLFEKYKKHTKLFILLFVGLVLVIGLILAKAGGKSPITTIIPVEQKTLISTVKASGVVTSVTDLELSFKTSDIVDQVSVSVGQKVTKGQILATLKNQNELGVVNQARGTLQAAQAGLERTLEGATTEETRIAEILLENAQTDYANVKIQQDILVENARRALYSGGLQARPMDSSDQSISSPQVFGTYQGTQEGSFIIEVYNSSGGYAFNVSGLASTNGEVSVSNTVSIGKGLALQFPVGFSLGFNKKWEIQVPNKESSVYTTNLNAYQLAQSTRESALKSAESLVKQREAELALKKAEARPSDVLAKQAEVIRAQGVLQSALGAYENTVIRAPADGTVTKVDVKAGELAKALEPVIVVQDVSNLYVEANINESNITTVLVGQPVVFTIDAFGSDRIFKGAITQVDLAPTIKDGIVNYKIKASVDEQDPLIKSGMNANITITTNTKENILVLPGATIEKKEDGTMVVKKITQEKKKKYVETPVVVGLVGDGNLTEIISGLTLGEKVGFIEKNK